MRRFFKKVVFFFMVFAVFVATTFISARQVQAAATKEKALKAYSEFLSKKTINWGTGATRLEMKYCKFALAYVDKDNIPELVLLGHSVNRYHNLGYGKLYTYRNGKVKLVRNLNANTRGGKVAPFRYYKKTGIYIDEYDMGGWVEEYYKLSNGKSKFMLSHELIDYGTGKTQNEYYMAGKEGKITKSKFQKERKKLVGNKKLTSVKGYVNTAANREKYLK